MTIYNKLIVGFLFLFLTHGCETLDRGQDISQIYNEYKQDNSHKNKANFFYAFPNTFTEFNQLYGYDDLKGAAPCYKVAQDHIKLFFDLADDVQEDVFCKKVLNICKDARWDADAVSYFQKYLRNYLLANKQLLNCISEVDKQQIYYFWYFISDEPHFNENFSKSVHDLIRHDDELMESYLKAVEEVKKDNVH